MKYNIVNFILLLKLILTISKLNSIKMIICISYEIFILNLLIFSHYTSYKNIRQY